MVLAASFYPLNIGLIIFFLCCIHQACSIGCFVCASVNGSEPDCEDTFNNTGKFYLNPCQAGRKGRMGLFPATECIKLIGEIPSTGYRVLIRTCVVDNGETNMETEIGRETHCWLVNRIKYNDRYMDGCSLACNTDGCNSAIPPGGRSQNLFISIFLVPVVSLIYFHT